MITIIAVGKDHEPMHKDAITLYSKRLTPYEQIKWHIIKPSGLDGDSARDAESAKIVELLKPSDYVVLLDETGASLSSPDIAAIIEKCHVSSRPLTCIIGGAYGVSSTLKNRADAVLAFGKAVFPHQLMRVMLLEQLYRACSINARSKYHHL